jgi:hypothetical protein
VSLYIIKNYKTKNLKKKKNLQNQNKKKHKTKKKKKKKIERKRGGRATAMIGLGVVEPPPWHLGVVWPLSKSKMGVVEMTPKALAVPEPFRQMGVAETTSKGQTLI